MEDREQKSYAFGKRYLVIGVLIYLIGTYIALNNTTLTEISSRTFYVFSGLFAVFLFCIAVTLYLIFRKHRLFTALILGGLIISLIFISSFSRAFFCINKFQNERALIDTHRTITGVVKTTPILNKSEKSFVFNLDVYSAESDADTVYFDDSCMVRAYVLAESLNKPPAIGDAITLKLNLSLMSKAAFEESFSFSRFLLQEKIVFAGYTNALDFAEPLPDRKGILPRLERAGLSIREHILRSADFYSYPSDEKQLLKGILVGETSEFSDELYNKYSNSGFIHIASVSGMHTSYLFLALSVLLGTFRFPKRAISLIAIPVMMLFASVALFTPSVTRAVITTSVFLLSSVIRRKNDSITALCIAGLILMIDNPYCIESCSALLSFGATLGILIYFPLFKSFFSFAICKAPLQITEQPFLIRVLSSAPHKISNYTVSSISLSLSASIGLIFFMLYFFGRIQWGGILGNIFIFPLVAIAFIFGYLNCIAGVISRIAAFILGDMIINPCLFLVNLITSLFDKGFFIIELPSPHKSFFPIYLLICYLIYILLTPAKKINKK